MKNIKTSGKYELDRARELVAQGWSNAQIKGVPICKDIPIGTLGAMRSRLKATKTAGATPFATVATEFQHIEATQEIETQPLENAATTPVLAVFIKTTLQNFHPADALYYLGVAMCCNGIIGALHGAGYPVAIVVAGVAVIALQGLKTETAFDTRLKYALAFVGVEVVAAISHIAWANAALWGNVSALPFDIRIAEFWSADAGRMKVVWIGSQTAWPFYAACGVAVVMFLSGVFTFFISIQKR